MRPEAVPESPAPAPSELQRHEDGRRLLQEARALGQDCEHYWRDVRDSTVGGAEIAYATDVDIVVMYTAPEKSAQYGEVFSDANEVSEGLAGLLGDWIVRQMPAQLLAPEAADPAAQPNGLLLIAPHDSELRRIGMRIAAAALEGSAAYALMNPKLERQARLELARDLERLPEPQGMAQLMDSLKNKDGKLAEWLDPAGPRAQMARLERLLPGRFIGVTQHPWFAGNGTGLLPPLRQTDPASHEGFTKRIDDWKDAMLKADAAHSGRSLTNLLDDAEVLARLEWINQRLAADAASAGRRRLVLISGTPRLFEAGSTMSSAHPDFKNFAQAYLRHPKSFLGVRDLFSFGKSRAEPLDSTPSSYADRTSFRVADWLSVMFPKHLEPDHLPNDLTARRGVRVKLAFTPPSDEEIEAGLHTLLNETYRGIEGKQFPKDALAEWTQTIASSKTALNVGWAEERSANLKAELQASLAASGQTDPVDVLLRILRRRAQHSFAALFGATEVLGVEQLLAPGQKMRGLPALKFAEDYTTAQRWVDNLTKTLFWSDDLERPKEVDLAAMYKELHQADESGYHARVLHAYVFACAGKWFQVRTLCLVALIVADDTDHEDKQGKRTGREAAYLLSVAERRLAQSESGLHDASLALKEARERARSESEPDLRFESEQLAQQVAVIQFKYYIHQRPLDMAELLRLMPTAKGLADRAEKALPTSVARWVTRQAVTNGLLLALMAFESRSPQHAQFTGDARTLIELLHKRLQAPNLAAAGPRGPAAARYYSDAVSDFIWLVAVAVFSVDPNQKARAKEWLAADYGQAQPTSALVPLEEVRRNRLLEMAGLLEAIPVKPR